MLGTPISHPNLMPKQPGCLLTLPCFQCYKAWMARIALYMTDEELGWIKLQAGDVALSKWCVKRLLGGKIEKEVMPPAQESNKTSVATAGTGERRAVAKTSAKTKTCIHGTPSGSRCWQCGGKAKLGEG